MGGDYTEGERRVLAVELALEREGNGTIFLAFSNVSIATIRHGSYNPPAPCLVPEYPCSQKF